MERLLKQKNLNMINNDISNKELAKEFKKKNNNEKMSKNEIKKTFNKFINTLEKIEKEKENINNQLKCKDIKKVVRKIMKLIKRVNDAFDENSFTRKKILHGIINDIRSNDQFLKNYI